MNIREQVAEACFATDSDTMTLPKATVILLLDALARAEDRVNHIEKERVGWQLYLDSVMPKPLNPNVVSSIRATKESGVNNKVNAQRHQVSESAVSRIVNGSRHRSEEQRNAPTRNA
jgi:hypothetical protein